MKIFFLILFLLLFFSACSSFKDVGKVMRNEKIKTTDEFLVKKKEPLVLPPDYNELPEPGSDIKKDKNITEEDKIKKILKVKKNKEESNQNKGNSIEKIILNEIKR